MRKSSPSGGSTGEAGVGGSPIGPCQTPGLLRCARNDEKKETKPFLPLRGRGLGVWGVHPLPFPFTLTLRPSKDEEAPRSIRPSVRVWIPAFAGNTGCA